MELSDLEQRVILALQQDLEVVPEPFEAVARRAGATVAEVLRVIQGLKERGIIRRFGATLRHQLSGFSANALVVWQVEAAELERVGRRLAAFRQVSHCYARRPAPGWPYTLYSMVHGRNPEEITALVAEMANEVGLDAYELLFSDQELKKTTMRYFREDDPE
ncbi:MAG: Lrp/AsnC family transcriptional regulator [Syntrophobacterales bacterium]|nr:Lrp/AsnC family transcriptional regulator [Syntrophobacterales bacterium]